MCKLDELDDDDTASCLKSICGTIDCAEAFCAHCDVDEDNYDECLESCKTIICDTVFMDYDFQVFEGTYSETDEDAFKMVGWALCAIAAAGSICLGLLLNYLEHYFTIRHRNDV